MPRQILETSKKIRSGRLSNWRKRNLELEKLELENKHLRRHWIAQPSIWMALVGPVLGLFGIYLSTMVFQKASKLSAEGRANNQDSERRSAAVTEVLYGSERNISQSLDALGEAITAVESPNNLEDLNRLLKALREEFNDVLKQAKTVARPRPAILVAQGRRVYMARHLATLGPMDPVEVFVWMPGVCVEDQSQSSPSFEYEAVLLREQAFICEGRCREEAGRSEVLYVAIVRSGILKSADGP